MAWLRDKKEFEIVMLLSSHLSFKAYEMYIPAGIFTHLDFWNKNNNLWFLLETSADVMDNLYNVCKMPELPERNFCDGLEMNLTSPLGFDKS